MITEVESRADMHFRLHHCCNAGGVAFFPEYAWDMVRPGILLYGSGDMAQEMGGHDLEGGHWSGEGL